MRMNEEHKKCEEKTESHLYKIGMFAQMNHITVKALRFYEEQGLLYPAHVDKENGYRYYTLDQMSVIHQITALKQAGFTLEDIRNLNAGNDEEVPVRKGLEWTFDTVASAYDKMRPGYVDELYQTIFEYIDINENSTVVEIGSGGGQATEPVLNTGCKLTAVEYGEQFSKLLKEKFGTYEKFSVITGKFEEVSFEEKSCDLIFSATAFHWIPEDAGYEKVYSMLKKGGVFARFANNPYRDKSNPELADEIDKIYDEYYYKYHNKKRGTLKEFDDERAKERAMIAAGYGFTDIRYALFHRERIFTADEYTELLGTYSDHISIAEDIRKIFFSKIKEAINKHGGTITIYDTIDLELARKM